MFLLLSCAWENTGSLHVHLVQAEISQLKICHDIWGSQRVHAEELILPFSFVLLVVLVQGSPGDISPLHCVLFLVVG